MFTDVTSIVEIGAGFGRTCQSILTLSSRVEKYVIVDLDPILELSRKYLKLAIPEFFDRVSFISSNDFTLQEQLKPDLVINIDSFQEMPLSIIDGYMNRIVNKTEKFYCKNPVGKYLPELVGMPNLSEEKLADVFKLDRCNRVIDIFSEKKMCKAREEYLENYLPPSGDSKNNEPNYKVVATKAMDLFSYFYHVLYKRS